MFLINSFAITKITYVKILKEAIFFYRSTDFLSKLYKIGIKKLSHPDFAPFFCFFFFQKLLLGKLHDKINRQKKTD